jgi:signal peptidase II
MKARALGGLMTLGVLFLDQASKLWLLYGLKMEDGEKIPVAPFLDLELLRNPGISFSLFRQETATGRWILLGLTLAATILLGAWLWRVRGKLPALALGAIVGGALGNGYDRFAYRSVVDFVDFHAFGYNFYVFNVADTAITLGVALLLFDSLVMERRAAPPDGAGGQRGVVSKGRAK